jgi:hypothetical protein
MDKSIIDNPQELQRLVEESRRQRRPRGRRATCVHKDRRPWRQGLCYDCWNEHSKKIRAARALLRRADNPPPRMGRGQVMKKTRNSQT